MTYVITEPCVVTLDTACAGACPVDAPMPEDDVPEKWAIFAEINRVHQEDGQEAGEGMLHDDLARTAGT